MISSKFVNTSPPEGTPIACDLTVLDDPEQHKDRSEMLFDEREEVREVSGGVALRFPGTMEYAERVLNFIRRERQCCPFLTFSVILEPEERGVWLVLGGDEQVESYIQDQFTSRIG